MSKRPRYTQILPKRVIDNFQRTIDANNHFRVDGKKESSLATRETRANRIMAAIADLWTLGFRIEKPTSLAPKHAVALVSRWESQGDSPGLLHTKLADLRTFAKWVGKGEDVVGHISVYLPHERTKRTVGTKVDKSWEANGVDADAMIANAYALDERFGAMLDAARHFGLRTKEAILLKPKKAVTVEKDGLVIKDGTKGGFARLIPFRDADQCHCVERLVKVAGRHRSGCLAWPDLTWEQAQNRFYILAKKIGLTKADIGVTPHGQRVGYAKTEYHYATGYLTPVEGGGPISEGKPDKIDRELHRRGQEWVSLGTGHRRIQVGGYYYGTHGHDLRPTKAEKEAKAKAESEGVGSPGGDVLPSGVPISFMPLSGQQITYNGHSFHWPV